MKFRRRVVVVFLYLVLHLAVYQVCYSLGSVTFCFYQNESVVHAGFKVGKLINSWGYIL